MLNIIFSSYHEETVACFHELSMISLHVLVKVSLILELPGTLQTSHSRVRTDMPVHFTFGRTSVVTISTLVKRFHLDLRCDWVPGGDVSVEVILLMALVSAHMATKSFVLTRAFLHMTWKPIVRNILQTVHTLPPLMRSLVIPIFLGC